jgi:hypothetical protein
MMILARGLPDNTDIKGSSVLNPSALSSFFRFPSSPIPDILPCPSSRRCQPFPLLTRPFEGTLFQSTLKSRQTQFSKQDIVYLPRKLTSLPQIGVKCRTFFSPSLSSLSLPVPPPSAPSSPFSSSEIFDILGEVAWMNCTCMDWVSRVWMIVLMDCLRFWREV